MEKIKTYQDKQLLTTTLYGCLLITLCSLVKIPFYPISFTLQTLALYILALSLSPKKACASALGYLLCATVGLPVLCGHANPLWILGKSSGYLLSFPLAAYGISKMKEYTHPFLALLLGQILIFSLGFFCLIPFVGPSVAWTSGVLIFIPSELLKALAALSLVRWSSK